MTFAPDWSDRFWSKVHPEALSGCWLWHATLDRNGYGLFHVAGRMRGSHRVAYELANGPIPDGNGYHGVCVCHSCDVRACVNPAHLFLGTNAENLADMRAKGRSRTAPVRGERHHRATLSDAQVAEIRSRHLGPGRESQRKLAAEYGVSHSAIGKIALGQNRAALGMRGAQ